MGSNNYCSFLVYLVILLIVVIVIEPIECKKKHHHHGHHHKHQSGGTLDNLGDLLEEDTQLEDKAIEVVNQHEIKESLDSLGLYTGIIGTGFSSGLAYILANGAKVLKSLNG